MHKDGVILLTKLNVTNHTLKIEQKVPSLKIFKVRHMRYSEI